MFCEFLLLKKTLKPYLPTSVEYKLTEHERLLILRCRAARGMSSRALLRVAAAENPAIKWGGSDVSCYTGEKARQRSVLTHQAQGADVFGQSMQVIENVLLI